METHEQHEEESVAKESKKARDAKAQQKALTKAERKEAEAREAKKQRGKQAWKLVGVGASVVAGIATTKALETTWRTATGKQPPTKPENPDIANREALLWAGLSGAAYGLAKTYFTRRAARYWVRSTGKLPPGMEEKASPKDKQKVKNAP